MKSIFSKRQKYEMHDQTIDLSRNKITAIPKEMGVAGALMHLEILELFENKISKISDAFYSQLCSLKKLNLNFNYLEELSIKILDLPHLEQLSIVGNRIKTVDSWLCDLKADVHFEWPLYCSKPSTVNSFSSLLSSADFCAIPPERFLLSKQILRSAFDLSHSKQKANFSDYLKASRI